MYIVTRDGHGKGREGRGDAGAVGESADHDLKPGAEGRDRGEDQVVRERPHERPAQRLLDFLGSGVLEIRPPQRENQ
jgi:hypothetical protein